MDNFENVNGGFPPIKVESINKNSIKKEKKFEKERGFTNTLNNVNIQNIIKSKKEDFIKSKEDTIDIVESF